MGLTRNEKDMFELVQSGGSTIALMQGTFQKKRAAFVCTVTRDGSDYIFAPIAVLLRPQDLDTCLDSYGRPLAKV